MEISVIVATYNGEKYIIDQLKSLVNQTKKPDEIVISDAGSEDDTVNLSREFLKNSGIFYRVIESKQRLSVNENFIKAVGVTRGGYIFFSDQDDVWKEDKVEIVSDKMLRGNYDCVFHNASVVDEDMNCFGYSIWDRVGFSVEYREKEFFGGDNKLFDKILSNGNVITGMCMAFKRDFILKYAEIPQGVLYDFWFAMCLTLTGTAFSLDRELVFYRQHKDNVCGGKKLPFIKRLVNTNARLKTLKSRLACYVSALKYCNCVEREKMNNMISFVSGRMKYIETKTVVDSSTFGMYLKNGLSIFIRDTFDKISYNIINR